MNLLSFKGSMPKSIEKVAVALKNRYRLKNKKAPELN